MHSTDKRKIPVMSLSQALETIQAVARGEAEPPEWAGKTVYIGDAAKRHWEQLEAAPANLGSFSKLMAENHDLIAAIARDKPESVADLASRVNRAESNVSRTLAKLVNMGLVQMIPATTGRTKRPTLTMEKVRFDLDLVTGEMSLTGMKAPDLAR